MQSSHIETRSAPAYAQGNALLGAEDNEDACTLLGAAFDLLNGLAVDEAHPGFVEMSRAASLLNHRASLPMPIQTCSMVRVRARAKIRARVGVRAFSRVGSLQERPAGVVNSPLRRAHLARQPRVRLSLWQYLMFSDNPSSESTSRPQ